MQWPALLSSQRLFNHSSPQKGRGEFQRDCDRIIFSAPFRRLQDKTQVQPMAEDDYVRTRLTHSIEVASVGRSLGFLVGEGLIKNGRDLGGLSATELGDIVQAACLAHDIGNPPFGHSGETVLQDWFKEMASEKDLFAGLSLDESQDFFCFDGNAQGFRLLTRLEMYRDKGGMQLTSAVLGAFLKYPRLCPGVRKLPNGQPAPIAGHKQGVFQSEAKILAEIVQILGLPKLEGEGSPQETPSWVRHPLAYLMEAADDICYSIIDLEDGYNGGYLDFDDVVDLLQPLSKPSVRSKDGANIASSTAFGAPLSRLHLLRAKAIHALILEVVDIFLHRELELLAGTVSSPLLFFSTKNQTLEEIRSFSKARLYQHPQVQSKELAGFAIIKGLLDILCKLALQLEAAGWEAEKLPGAELRLNRVLHYPFAGIKSRYEALHAVTDFISALSDGAALRLFRRLNGHSL
jgi:dGTPase